MDELGHFSGKRAHSLYQEGNFRSLQTKALPAPFHISQFIHCYGSHHYPVAADSWISKPSFFPNPTKVQPCRVLLEQQFSPADGRTSAFSSLHLSLRGHYVGWGWWAGSAPIIKVPGGSASMWLLCPCKHCLTPAISPASSSCSRKTFLSGPALGQSCRVAWAIITLLIFTKPCIYLLIKFNWFYLWKMLLICPSPPSSLLFPLPSLSHTHHLPPRVPMKVLKGLCASHLSAGSSIFQTHNWLFQLKN